MVSEGMSERTFRPPVTPKSTETPHQATGNRPGYAESKPTYVIDRILKNDQI